MQQFSPNSDAVAEDYRNDALSPISKNSHYAGVYKYFRTT